MVFGNNAVNLGAVVGGMEANGVSSSVSFSRGVSLIQLTCRFREPQLSIVPLVYRSTIHHGRRFKIHKGKIKQETEPDNPLGSLRTALSELPPRPTVLTAQMKSRICYYTIYNRHAE